ncbi:SCO family protein [Sphingomonas changnyeongensis]|uniref:SCO family protein n=2 Tax=Sphingomonas changnyeongensis TaxID=2698679 RepID=A0A7Z2S576_9SPHN|nr:SCO family protein [Sphingomonas changnyeongensis]
MCPGAMTFPLFRRAACAAFAPLLMIAACSAPAPAPPLADARIGGPLMLTTQDGQRLTDADLAGKYRLIYFGYSYCPDVCPVDLQNLMAGFAALEKSDPAVAARIQPIFVSIDPARDTPAQLKTYVRAFHPRLIGLTGTDAEIARVAKDYAVFYQREGKPGAADYLMNHSRIAYLMGPDGKPIALAPHDAKPEAIAAELKQWVR